MIHISSPSSVWPVRLWRLSGSPSRSGIPFLLGIGPSFFLQRGGNGPASEKSVPVAGPTPQSTSLSSYIEDQLDGFSRSQKDVARYIVDHLDEAAFLTAEELARRAGTSSSTVVRFSQALGFEGFPELQASAIEEYRATVGAEGGSGRALFSFDRSDFEASLGTDHANLEETARKIKPDQIDEAVAALSSASQVVIVGTDQMAFFASYLRHTLSLLDIRAEIVTSTAGPSLQRLGRIDEETVVVVLTAGRAHALIGRALKLAEHRNARTLAIADASLSDTVKRSDMALYFSSNSPSFFRSSTALMAVVHALAHGVYSRDEDAHRDRIRAYKLK